MSSAVGLQRPGLDGDYPSVVWVGPDERGVELEIVALLLPDLVLVIHVMPTSLRRRKS